MRACIQRVRHASVTVRQQVIGKIGRGFLVLLGVAQNDTEADLNYLAEKIIGLRVFEDRDGKMNLSIKDVQGEMLVVSQFTLYGDCRKGRRPSFVAAAQPDQAKLLYEQFVQRVTEAGITVATGQFREHMDVELLNDGPVTLILDSNKDF